MPTWAGLWNGVYGQSYALTGQKMVLPRRVGMAYARDGMAVQKELSLTLNGVVPGSTALATARRVEAVQSDASLNLGGVRNISTVTLINRATTAADVTVQADLFDAKFAPTTYPVDKSGNGGGGKVNSL